MTKLNEEAKQRLWYRDNFFHKVCCENPQPCESYVVCIMKGGN